MDLPLPGLPPELARSHTALMAAYLRTVAELQAAELENDRYRRLLGRLSKSIERARRKSRKRRKPA